MELTPMQQQYMEIKEATGTSADYVDEESLIRDDDYASFNVYMNSLYDFIVIEDT